MATKKKKRVSGLEKFATLIMEHITTELSPVRQDIAEIKTDLALVRSIATSNSEHLVSIESEIKGVRADAAVANKRITTIETRLNLDKKIAA